MYKCSECGQEFKEKPDYCDCGNDIFIEIKEETVENKKAKKQKIKKTFVEQYPWFEDFKNSLDPLSVIIFFICVILSFCLILFVKPAKQIVTEETQLKNEIVENVVVANIDSFWNDTPPKIIEKKESVVQPQQIKQENIQKIITPKVSDKPKTEKVIVKTQPVKKAIQQSKTQTKNTQKNVVVQNNKINVQNNTATKTQTKQNTITQTKQTQNQNNVQQKQQQVQAPVQNIKPLNTSNQELKTYKTGLRNTITSKINFENIYGNGTCEVTFSINSKGKLENKKFSKQSDDGTLNDEVYEAIMSTPKYQIPPESYNGEVLHYAVKMKNGNYSAILY